MPRRRGLADPAGFELVTAATQRTPDDLGAVRRLRSWGDALRAQVWAPPLVYTSRWCRAQENC